MTQPIQPQRRSYRAESNARITIWVGRHDTDAINHGSGELNLKPEHHRPHTTPYFWTFRASEGVDISYTKDFADFNDTNFVAPATNQLYIGWTADGEWCNYTVDVKRAGTYRIQALYGNAANAVMNTEASSLKADSIKVRRKVGSTASAEPARQSIDSVQIGQP